MRHCLFATLICLLAVSCSGKGDSRTAVAGADTASLADSAAVVLQAGPHVGKLMSRVFMGTCEDDAICILTLFNHEHSGDGVFSLTILRPGSGLSVHKGRVYTLRGTDDATLWQCVSGDGAHTFYFLLDADGQKIYKETNDADYTREYVLSALSLQTSAE